MRKEKKTKRKRKWKLKNRNTKYGFIPSPFFLHKRIQQQGFNSTHNCYAQSNSPPIKKLQSKSNSRKIPFFIKINPPNSQKLTPNNSYKQPWLLHHYHPLTTPHKHSPEIHHPRRKTPPKYPQTSVFSQHLHSLFPISNHQPPQAPTPPKHHPPASVAANLLHQRATCAPPMTLPTTGIFLISLLLLLSRAPPLPCFMLQPLLLEPPPYCDVAAYAALTTPVSPPVARV